MATHWRGQVVKSLVWVAAACFGVYGCSSEQPDAYELESSEQDEAADPDETAGAVAEMGSDMAAVGDGLVGSGSLTGLEQLSHGGLGSPLAETIDQALEAEAASGTMDSALPAVTAVEARRAKSAKAPNSSLSPAELAAGASAETFEYKVVRGDWLSKLAGRVYGDIYKWPLIASANPQLGNPHKIFPGRVIKVPITGDSSKAFAAQYKGTSHTEATPPAKAGSADTALTQITVVKGDTLVAIAKRVAGNAGAWKQIWELNKAGIANPDLLQVGQIMLVSPPVAKASPRSVKQFY